jgi:hypothetical protein
MECQYFNYSNSIKYNKNNVKNAPDLYHYYTFIFMPVRECTNDAILLQISLGSTRGKCSIKGSFPFVEH